MGNKAGKPTHPSQPQIEVPSTRRVNLKREVLLMRQMRHQQNYSNEIKSKNESKTELAPLLPEKGESISVLVPPRRRRSSTIKGIKSEPDIESMLGNGKGQIGQNQIKIQSTASAACDNNPNNCMVFMNHKSSISKSNSRKSKVKSSIDFTQNHNTRKTAATRTTRTRKVNQMLFDSNGNIMQDNRKDSIGDGLLKNDENGNFYVNAPHKLVGGGRDSSIIVLKSNVKRSKRKDNNVDQYKVNKKKESKKGQALWDDGDKNEDKIQQEDELLEYDPKTKGVVNSKQEQQRQPTKESSQAFEASSAYGDSVSARNSQKVRGGDSSTSNGIGSMSQYSSVSAGSESKSRSKKKNSISNSNSYNGSSSKSKKSLSKSAAGSNRPSKDVQSQSQSQSKGGETSSYVAKRESRGPDREKGTGARGNGNGESSGNDKSSRPYNNCRLRCCPPPCFISSGGCGSSSKKNCCDENPIERLNNVDIIEELCYYPPGDPCCAEYDYYTYNECGDLEKISCPPQSTNPVKYCRKQRFNFKKNRNEDSCGDGPPFSWTGNCATDPCPTCCCSPRLFRRQSSFDELPVGRNPIACKPVPSCCDGGAGSTCSSSEDEDLIPCESGVYFYDAKEKKFIRQMVEDNPSKNKKDCKENENGEEECDDDESDPCPCPCPCPNPCPPQPRTPQPAYVCEEYLNEPINTIQQIVQPCIQPVAAQCCQIPIICNPCNPCCPQTQNPCCPQQNPCCPQQNNCCNGNGNNGNGNNGNNNNNNNSNNKNGNKSKRQRREKSSAAYYNESSYDYDKDKYEKRNKNGSGDPYYEDKDNKDKKKKYSGDGESDYTNSYSYSYSTGDGDYDDYSSSNNYSSNKNNNQNNNNNNNQNNNCCPPGCQPIVQQPAQNQNPCGGMGCMPIVMCGNMCNQNNNQNQSYGYSGSGSYPYSDYYDYSDYGYSGSSGYSYDYAYDDESKKDQDKE